MVKNLTAMQETWVWPLAQEDPLEKGMATHSSILVWKIPGTEEPDGLQSTQLQRVGHNWATNTFTFIFTQDSKPSDIPQDGGKMSFLSSASSSAPAKRNHTDCLGLPTAFELYLSACQEPSMPTSPNILILLVLQGSADISSLLESLPSSLNWKGSLPSLHYDIPDCPYYLLHIHTLCYIVTFL